MSIAQILRGTLSNDPPPGCEADAFPSGSDSIDLSFYPAQYPAGSSTGAMAWKGFSSPSAFTALAGIGAGGPVLRGTIFYFRSNVPILLRLTFSNGSDPDIVSTIPVKGPFVQQVDESKYLKLVEVKGSSDAIEWFAAGPV